MASAPLTLRFASDVDSAKKGIASLAVAIAGNMTSIERSAIAAGKGVAGAGNSVITSLQQMQRSSSLIAPAFGAMALGAGVAYVAFKALNAITELGKERLEQYVKIAEQASAGGVGAEFFQRQAKAAEDAKIKIDDVAASLKKFREVTAQKLGGSDFENRLDELSKAGNFSGNSGVQAYKSANSDEERYRAVVKLIDEAMQKGERLAALDLAAKFLPPSMLEQLRANADYLKQMQERADKLAATSIISNEDIARAQDLQRRLDEAHKTLAERFKPIQNDLAGLGLNYHENWVSIVQDLASAVKLATDLYQALKQVPEWFAKVGNASVWKSISDFTGGLGLNSDISSMEVGGSANPSAGGTPEMEAERKRLSQGLKDPAAVRLTQEQATNVTYGAIRDTSRAPKPAATTDKEALDQVERLINLLQKENDVLQVELDTIGKSNVEKEKGIALAKAAAAARAAGRDLTEDEKNKVLALAEAHAVLANRLKDVQQAMAANAEAARFFGNTASGALADVFIDGRRASDVLDGLLKQFARMALQAAFTGQGSLASLMGLAPLASAGPNAVGGIAGMFTNLFGGGGASVMSSGLGAGTGGLSFPMFRAGGGDVQAGRAYRVGEVRDEIFVPGENGRIYPIGAGGRGSSTFAPVYQINAAGADAGTVDRIHRVLSDHAQAIGATRSGMTSAQHYSSTGVSMG